MTLPETDPAMTAPHRLPTRVLAFARHAATWAIAALAVAVAVMTWLYYERSPWTRNGMVRVQVASVAPQVSGRIVDLRVADNEKVSKGDVLYVVEPADFRIALAAAQAGLDQAAADLEFKQAEAQRRQKLTDLAVTAEEQQQYVASAAEAKAVFQSAQQALLLAQLNLERTEVRSPVNGYVTNLLLRAGDYAQAGAPNVSVIDSDSFWIDGYFEETKLSRICTGDRVEARLLGYPQPVIGRVETLTRGISVANAAAGPQGLPDVNPIYTWVQLAQRVPVRIAITDVPTGVPLVSGLTATLTVRDAAAAQKGWLQGRIDDLVAVLPPALGGPQLPVAGCVTDPVVPASVAPEAVPAAPEPAMPTAEEAEPEIAPGLDLAPRSP